MSRSLVLAAATCAALALSALAPASAHAAAPAAQRVSYADLNLDSERGARLLLRRIRAAAETVCHAGSAPLSLRAWQAARACARQATGRAVAQVNDPTLTALYEGRRRTMYASL